MIEEHEVEIESGIKISSSLDICHQSHKGKKLEAWERGSPAANMELVFDFKFSGPVARPHQIINPPSK
jgi:hypothetical protein